MHAVLQGLEARATVAQRVALVVAHADDETIALGGSFHLIPNLVLIHVTDGAPRDVRFAVNAGFATVEAYAAARAAELDRALSAGRWAPLRIALGMADQEASLDLSRLARRLSRVLDEAGATAVITHAYEGGHPDHDAVAWAVHMAAGDRAVLEFAGYHADAHGVLQTGRFLPGPEAIEIVLSAAERARKTRMFDCFRSQAETLRWFGRGTETFRAAPSYDFAKPPVPWPLNYERWKWDMTGERWRSLAGSASCAA